MLHHKTAQSYEVRNILTEELAELIQALQKYERFCSGRNEEELIEKIQAEAGDALAAISLALQAGILDHEKIMLYAAEKVARYKTGEVTFVTSEQTLKELKLLKI